MEIINIGNHVVNNYLIKTSKGYVVVDTGYAGNYNRFCKKLSMMTPYRCLGHRLRLW
jgi:flavorubredoxin